MAQYFPYNSRLSKSHDDGLPDSWAGCSITDHSIYIFPNPPASPSPARSERSLSPLSILRPAFDEFDGVLGLSLEQVSTMSSSNSHSPIQAARPKLWPAPKRPLRPRFRTAGPAWDRVAPIREHRLNGDQEVAPRESAIHLPFLAFLAPFLSIDAETMELLGATSPSLRPVALKEDSEDQQALDLSTPFSAVWGIVTSLVANGEKAIQQVLRAK